MWEAVTGVRLNRLPAGAVAIDQSHPAANAEESSTLDLDLHESLVHKSRSLLVCVHLVAK